MGKKNKLQRYREVSDMEIVLEYTDFENRPDGKPKGEWHQKYFGNGRPIILELACGKGDYALNLARREPELNVVGVDIKGARIWKGATTARDEGVENVRFLRIFIDHLDEYFDRGEVSEIWITFPDPYLKEKKESKRLTSPRFLDTYRKVLAPGGEIHLKTDSLPLYEYTLETIRDQNCELLDQVDDVYRERPEDPLLTIQTYYEKMHLRDGKTIRYVRFRI
ncbi:MAG: tRNA (guanosine(46)-N7)-methyltransferase TrmB [Balneolaceae bacterium]